MFVEILNTKSILLYKNREIKMIIDFHTHVFPEFIAAKTFEKLGVTANTKVKTNGLLNSLKSSTKNSGIDYSVLLPVVTNPKQFPTLTDMQSP